MQLLNKQAVQGDLHFRKIDHVPEDVTPVKAVNGEFIVAHSETGHHHVLPQTGVSLFSVNGNPFLMIAKIEQPAMLFHKRSFDTHDSVLFQPGVYAFHRQRQHTPEGMVRVVD